MKSIDNGPSSVSMQCSLVRSLDEVAGLLPLGDSWWRRFLISEPCMPGKGTTGPRSALLSSGAYNLGGGART
jgi:hypothetical protein